MLHTYHHYKHSHIRWLVKYSITTTYTLPLFSSSTLISIISFLFYFISFPPFLSPSTKTKTTLNKNNTLIIYTVGRSIGRCPTSYRRCGLTAVEPKDQSVGTCVSRDRGMGLLAMAVPFASRPQGRWGFGEYFKFFKLYITETLPYCINACCLTACCMCPPLFVLCQSPWNECLMA